MIDKREQPPAIDPAKIRSEAAKAEAKRTSGILSIADGIREQVDLSQQAREYLADPNKSEDDFQRLAFEELKKTNGQRLESTEVGMSDQEVRSYDLGRAVQALMNKKPLDGLEREASEAMAKIVGRSPEGFYIPQDFLNRGWNQKRDQVVGTASTGGNVVATNLLGGDFINLLRNRTVVRRLGATVISGLTGNVAIPRQSAAATAYNVDETTATTESNVTFDQVNGNPKAVSAYVEYSKRLLNQASIAISAFLEDDLTKIIALKQDLNALNGSGSANEPLGIINTTGINTVTFGAAATFGKMVDMESAVETDNALMGALAYCTTAAAKGKLKQKVVDAGSGRFVWTSIAGDPAQDGEVNGYRAASTNQVPSDKAIFGNWSDLVILEWAGLDVTLDEITKAEQRLCKLVVSQDQDVIVRHPVSFCVSTDSAAQ